MIPIRVRDDLVAIRPIDPDELEAVLAVYRECEDFLALGPVPTASMEMVRKDIELSRDADGLFCGIYTAQGRMIGILDYVPSHYDGDPRAAYLALLMIAVPFRQHGIGHAVVEAIERAITRQAPIDTIWAGVQVNNPRAMTFWQRHGYRIVSEPKVYPDQTTAVDLRKDLVVQGSSLIGPRSPERSPNPGSPEQPSASVYVGRCGDTRRGDEGTVSSRRYGA